MQIARATTDLDERKFPSLGEAVPALALEAVDLTVRFAGPDHRSFTALDRVSLAIAPGRIVCLIGPSGCGKSTLLNVFAGLIRPVAGSVSCYGKAVNGPNTACGYMTQHDTLLPWARVEANVALGLRVHGVRRKQRAELVDEALSQVGLRAFAQHYPSQLSGGMRKRAQLARMLVYRPDVLVMDEPFGALDALMRYHLQLQLLSLWDRERKTLVFVTHDLDEAVLLADEIVVMNGNPGRIVDHFSVDLERPRDLRNLREDPQFAVLWARLWECLDTSALLTDRDSAQGPG